MRKTKNAIIVVALTIIWFSCFTGSSEVICYGDPFGRAFGNFVLWNTPDPTTSLGKLVDLRLFCVDFVLSYFLTLIVFFLAKNIFKIKKTIFEKKWGVLLLSVLTCLLVGFFVLSFSFGINFNTIDCDKVPETFSFGLRYTRYE